MASSAGAFINDINVEYEKLHHAFEEQFWGTKMALADPKFSVDELTRTKTEMEAFLADEAKLKTTREWLGKATGDDVRTLKTFERTFGCYIMESEEAKRLRTTSTELEGSLEDARNKMSLGATIDGRFEELSSVGLRSKMRVNPDEAVRKACFEGLRYTQRESNSGVDLRHPRGNRLLPHAQPAVTPRIGRSARS